MEKQKQVRRTKRIEVRFGADRPSQLGFTIDMSETGLFIKTTTIFPPYTTLLLELTLPDKRVVSLRGHVSWVKRVPAQLAPHVKKAGMGIELLQPPAEYLEFVKTLAGAPAAAK